MMYDQHGYSAHLRTDVDRERRPSASSRSRHSRPRSRSRTRAKHSDSGVEPHPPWATTAYPHPTHYGAYGPNIATNATPYAYYTALPVNEGNRAMNDAGHAHRTPVISRKRDLGYSSHNEGGDCIGKRVLWLQIACRG